MAGPGADGGRFMQMLDDRAGFRALENARTPRIFRRMGRIIVAAIAIYIVAIAVLPWQQFVRGSGRVIAYNPLDRPLTLEAPLSGRVAHSEVFEGDRVRKGQILFRMTDNDPELLTNLTSQRNAAGQKADASRNTVWLMEERLREVRRSVDLAVEGAEARLEAAEAKAATAGLQYDRISTLRKDPRGLVSQRDYELALLGRNEADADLAKARADLEKARTDGRASVRSAESSLESARSSLAEAEQSLTSLDIKVSQTRTLDVVAPRDAVVLRLMASEGDFLSSGSPVAVLVPETENRLAEVYIDGNDVPLVQPREVDAQGNVVTPGTPVRLQFEGWPAVQFMGWPSVSRGTFAGEVVNVDATDNGKGEFRVLVAPRPDTVSRGGEAEVVDWPGSRWLRQGTRVNSWLLLQRVPLWFEIWRQLNGFPPILEGGPSAGGEEVK